METNHYGLQVKTLFDVGSSIAQDCVKVLPMEPKRKLQKFVIGTQKYLEIWECKKGEMINSFKSENQA
jgi:hypothetical protein